MIGLFYIIRSDYREFAVTPFVVLDIREGVPPRGVDGGSVIIMADAHVGQWVIHPASILWQVWYRTLLVQPM